MLCDCALHSLVFHPVLPAVTQRSETVGCLQGKILKASRFPPGAPSRIKKASHNTSPNPYLPTTERGGGEFGGEEGGAWLFRHHFHSHSSKRSTLFELVRTRRGAEITLLRVFWLQLPSADCTSRRIQESRGRLSLPANYRLRKMELGYPLMAIVRMITTLTCFLRALVLVAQG